MLRSHFKQRLLKVIIPTKMMERGRMRMAVLMSYFWTGNCPRNESSAYISCISKLPLFTFFPIMPRTQQMIAVRTH